MKLIIDAYRAGASTYELAERYGVRRKTIRDILKRNHVPLTGAKVKLLTDEDKVEIRRRRKGGVTVMELAVEYGASGSTIRRAETGPTEPAPPKHKNVPNA